MLRRQILTGLALLALVAPQGPARAETVQQGYLSLMYFIQIMPGCGMQEPAFSTAPFRIVDGTIEGEYEVGEGPPMTQMTPRENVLEFLEEDLDLPESLALPGEFPHYIEYSWTCKACTESGYFLYHRVWGKVETRGGKSMLHFYVSHSRPYCTNTCLVPSKDCSDREVVTDEFITPFENGYIVDRGARAPFKYGVYLQ